MSITEGLIGPIAKLIDKIIPDPEISPTRRDAARALCGGHSSRG